MYPRNAASPPRLSIGAVVQISDGAVQTSGVSVKVRPEGGSASAGGGTIAYEEGVVLYTPTQAETNYTAFVVIAYKTGCVPVSLAVVTVASATAGVPPLPAITSGWLTATGIASGAITNAKFASGAIDASAIASNAFAAAKFASDFFTALITAIWTTAATRVLTAATNLTTALATPTNITAGTITTVSGNVSGSVGSIATGGITAASFAADAMARLGIVAYGTAQGATSTTLQLASAAAFADDELIGAVLVITGGSAGVGQSRVITDYAGSTDTATVDAWTTTPTGTITYVIFAAPPASAIAIPSVNVASINGATITGDGDGSPFDVA